MIIIIAVVIIRPITIIAIMVTIIIVVVEQLVIAVLFLDQNNVIITIIAVNSFFIEIAEIISVVVVDLTKRIVFEVLIITMAIKIKLSCFDISVIIAIINFITIIEMLRLELKLLMIIEIKQVVMMFS